MIVTVFNGDERESLDLRTLKPRVTPLREVDLVGAVQPVEDRVPRNRVEEIIKAVCKDTQCLGPDLRTQFEQVISDNMSVFAEHDMDVGSTTRICHEIDTGDARPIRQHPRRIPYGEAREEASKQVKALLRGNLVRPSNSPWAQPIVMVRKKDGSWRMCVDYRRVNAITRKDSFPLPRIDEALDALSGSRYYCTIDLVKGYHQIPVRPKDVEKTAFVTHDGLFEYVAMPFGLCNAPGTCQRLMYLVLEGLIGRECLSYIDDILIYGKTRVELLDRLARVLTRLREAGLKVKPTKCRFFEEEVTFLGHRVNSAGVRPDDFKIKAVMEWPEPSTVKDLQGFLGLVNYFNRYIANFATLASPLYERIKMLRSTSSDRTQFDRARGVSGAEADSREPTASRASEARRAVHSTDGRLTDSDRRGTPSDSV